MTEREMQLAATLAVVFDHEAVRRHLVLHHPAVLERARVALAVHERLAERLEPGALPPSSAGA